MGDVLGPKRGEDIVTTGTQSGESTGGSTGLTTGTSTGTTTGQSSSAGTTTGQTAVDVPAWLQPLIQGTAGNAGSLIQSLMRGVRGPLVEGFSPDQLKAFQGIRDFGTSSPFTTGLNAMESTARGDFLFGGPQQQAFIDASVRSAMPGLLSTFGRRSSGGLAQTAIARQAQDSFAGLFESERARQMAAAGALPGISALPLNMQLGVGNQIQDLNQRRLTAPITAQQGLLASIMGLPGSFAPLFGQNVRGTTTGLTDSSGRTVTDSSGRTSTDTFGTTSGNTSTSQPTFSNPLGEILGLGLGGLGLASGFGGAMFGADAMSKGLMGLLGLGGSK